MARKKYKLGLLNILEPWTVIPGLNQAAQAHPWMYALPALVAAPYLAGALGAGGAAAAGAGAGAGEAAAIPVTGGLATGMSLAGPVAAAAPTAGSAGGFMAGLGPLLATHPGWSGALKSAGKFGAVQGAQALLPQPTQPTQPQPPPQFQAGQFGGQGAGLGVDNSANLTLQQLARLRAYFSPYGQGGGGNGY